MLKRKKRERAAHCSGQLKIGLAPVRSSGYSGGMAGKSKNELTHRQFAALGGVAAMKKLSPEERSEKGRAAIQKRWSDYRARRNAEEKKDEVAA
jgi:hypothetical protein